MRAPEASVVGLVGAIVVVCGVSLVCAGDPDQTEPPALLPFAACGTLELDDGSGCVVFVTHNGGTYAVENVGTFDAGDSVCVSGLLPTQECPMSCGPATDCVVDNTIDAQQTFDGCGTVETGPGGCLVFDSEDGRQFLLDIPANMTTVGEQVYLGAFIVPNYPSCVPAVGNALEVVSVNPCRAGDVTRDGVVNIEDLLEVLADWGPCAGCRSDLNHDGFITVDELLIVLANW